MGYYDRPLQAPCHNQGAYPPARIRPEGQAIPQQTYPQPTIHQQPVPHYQDSSVYPQQPQAAGHLPFVGGNQAAQQEIAKLKEQLAATENQLSQTQEELTQTKGELKTEKDERIKLGSSLITEYDNHYWTSSTEYDQMADIAKKLPAAERQKVVATLLDAKYYNPGARKDLAAKILQDTNEEDYISIVKGIGTPAVLDLNPEKALDITSKYSAAGKGLPFSVDNTRHLLQELVYADPGKAKARVEKLQDTDLVNLFNAESPPAKPGDTSSDFLAQMVGYMAPDDSANVMGRLAQNGRWQTVETMFDKKSAEYGGVTSLGFNTTRDDLALSFINKLESNKQIADCPKPLGHKLYQALDAGWTSASEDEAMKKLMIQFKDPSW